MNEHEVIAFKRKRILGKVGNDPDPKYLREFCITTYGLMDNEVRKLVWPIILDIPNEQYPHYDDDRLREHSSYHQVQLDVNRLDSLLPSDYDADQKDEVRVIMMRLVVSVLMDNPDAHYYQGFHDICYIFLSVLGEDGARSVINTVLPKRFSLFMEPTMDGTVEYMQLIFALLGHLRPELTSNLEAVGLGPHFAVAWIVTWFAHVLPEMDDVRRLFDLFLATDPLMLIYLSVSVIIHSDEEVQSTAADFGMLHHTLLRLPKRHPVEKLVRYAVKLYSNVPPVHLLQLGSERRILLAAQQKEQESRKSLKSRHSSRSNVKWYIGALLIAAIAYAVYWWR